MEPEEPLHRHNVHLFAGDYERLQNLYPDFGAAIIIRNLVRNHLQQRYEPLDLTKIKLQVKL